MKMTKNFSLKEFACKNGEPVPEELLKNAQELAENLQVLRDYFGLPVRINSAYRSLEYNRSIGSKDTSQHVKCKAADIVVKGKKPLEVNQAISKLIAEGKMKEGGLGIYNTFNHYDIRGYKARWDFRK